MTPAEFELFCERMEDEAYKRGVAAERERCARIIEQWQEWPIIANRVAAAIRRGEP